MNEEFDLERFKEFIKKERSLKQLTKLFDMTEYEIMAVVRSLKQEGYNIINVRKDDDISIINLGDRNINNDNCYNLDLGDLYSQNTNDIPRTNTNDIPKKKSILNFKLAAISDTRLCSKFQQLTILNNVYEMARKEGIHHIFHCGDISEGLYNSKSPYYDSIFEHDTYLQADYIIEHYPRVEGIKTYFITGDQDHTHVKENDISIGRLISGERDDMIYLGHTRCTVNIRNFKLMVHHPKGKIAYTVSYKPQRFISAMRSEDKPDMLLHGHWLQCEDMNFRDVQEYSVPGLVATTPRIKDEGIENETGALFLDITLNDKDELKKVRSRIIPFYVTDPNDYVKAKVLKMGGIK